ncbi:MAG: hypothetical protein ACTSW1_15360 [Candidatus Hodarchaeales archaeon]
MKNKERYLYIVTIIIITSISIIGKTNFTRDFQLLEETQKTRINSIKETNITELQSENFELNPVGMIYNKKNDTINLSQLSQHPKLVLYHNDNSCGVCIDSLLVYIANYSGLASKHFVILSSPRSYRDVVAQVTNKNYSTDIYSIITDLGVPLCDQNIPFLFLLDNDLCVKCLFVPNRAEPTRTKQYLDIVYNRFINEKMGYHN